MGKGRVHELHPRNLVGCMGFKTRWPPRQQTREEGTLLPFMAASVAVLLRGPFHGDRVQYKFGVLEPNN